MINSHIEILVIACWISEDLNNSYYFVYTLNHTTGQRDVIECESLEEVESLIEDNLWYNDRIDY